MNNYNCEMIFYCHPEALSTEEYYPYFSFSVGEGCSNKILFKKRAAEIFPRRASNSKYFYTAKQDIAILQSKVFSLYKILLCYKALARHFGRLSYTHKLQKGRS